MLRETFIPAAGHTKVEIASALGVSRETLYKLLNEKQRVTPELAAKLGKVFGTGPAVWLKTQAALDIHHAEQMDLSEVRELEST